MSSTDMGINVLADYIRQHATYDDLAILTDAIAQRREQLRDQNANAIQTGVQVVLLDTTPKYLTGLIGTVIAITTNRHRRRATIALDRDFTRRLASASTKYRHLAERDTYELTKIPLAACASVHR